MTVYLVRHAVAVGRQGWDGRDTDRPLTSKGERQATALPRLFESAEVRRIASSPATRCVDTVTPLAGTCGLEVRPAPELAEGADAKEAVAFLRELAAKKGDTVLCAHGDLIPEILRKLTRDGMRMESELQFAKGSTWELVVDGDDVVSGRYHPPAE